MKRSFLRFMSYRWFTRLLSIVTVVVMALAGPGFLAVQQALAGIVCCTNSTFTDCLCDPSLVCNITSSGKFYGTQVLGKTCWNTSLRGAASTIHSTISCVNANGSGGTTTLDSTSLTRSGLLFCTVNSTTNSSENGTSFCQLNLSYSQAGLSTCVDNLGNPGAADDTSTLTYSAVCKDALGGNPKLAVTGTLKCGPNVVNPPQPLAPFCVNNDCTLNLGIAGTTASQCTTLFPPDGQVLSFTQTVAGLGCGAESPVIQTGELDAEYCNGGTFDKNAPVDCVSGNKGQTTFTGFETSANAVQFDVKFSPTTLNLNCGPNNNDTWNFTITANQHLPDLSRIITSPPGSGLKVEGVPGEVTCDSPNTTVVPNTLTCHVNACQQDPNLCDIGPVVCANRNADGTADLRVTGTLKDPATPIFGDDQNHKTSGQCQSVPQGCFLE